MRIFVSCLLLIFAVSAFAQDQPPAQSATQAHPDLQRRQPNDTRQDTPEESRLISLPTGTKVLLVLKNTVSSKNGKIGDGVYLETTFPVTANSRVVIPAGTYVQGQIAHVQNSGRVKGRAEIQLRFTSLIFNNGYTVNLAGSLESADSSDSQRVKNDGEGTVQADGSKGKDAATIATTTGTGTLIGGLSHGLKGAGIGAGAGAAIGVLTTMLTRGDEVRLEGGTTIEMVLQRPLDLELDRIDSGSDRRPPTPQRWRTLPSNQQKVTATPGIGIPGVPK